MFRQRRPLPAWCCCLCTLCRQQAEKRCRYRAMACAYRAVKRRQAEKRQHRGACALLGSKAVWWGSGLSEIGNVNVDQRSAKGKRVVGPVVASEHQAEKLQHRGACALRGSKAVWWESGLSVILNDILGAMRSSARGSTNGEAVGPAVASETIGTPWSGWESPLESERPTANIKMAADCYRSATINGTLCECFLF